MTEKERNIHKDIGQKDVSSIGQKSENKMRSSYWKGLITGIAAAFILTAAVWAGTHLADVLTGGGFASEHISRTEAVQKLDQISRLINEYYLYDDQIDKDSLIDGMYSGYLSALEDPYTVYYDREETEEMNESTAGEFVGIGVGLSSAAEEEYPVITEVYPDSPAEKAGLIEGDRLLKVNGKNVSGKATDEIVSWIQGEAGTKVTLLISRDGSELEVEAELAVVEKPTVEYEMKDGQTGYIRIIEFDTVTYDQFKKAFEDLQSQNMDSLVIDLRGNPGGGLTTVTDILKLILPKGLIVSVRDKDGKTTEYTGDGSHEFTKPLAVLVNEKSASAAEIFAAAVQDYGIGTIVGTTTYGKGVVQQIFRLKDGTSVKITMAEYFTPKGKSINGTGVKPDVEVKYEEPAEGSNADNQLEEALKIVNAGNPETGKNSGN